MIEIGKKFPSVNMLKKIAAALGVDTSELFSTNTVVLIPSQDKSIELLHNEIMEEIDKLKSNITEKIRKIDH